MGELKTFARVLPVFIVIGSPYLPMCSLGFILKLSCILVNYSNRLPMTCYDHDFEYQNCVELL